MQPEHRLSVLERAALGVYSLIMRVMVPLLRRKLQRRGQAEPGYLAHVEQRFGHYPGLESMQGALWVHAVSLGETRAAGLLLGALRVQRPGLRILLTHGTATGRAEGAQLLAPGDVQVWQPWDTPEAVKRFLTHFRPAFCVLMETEVWPNWVRACEWYRVPVALVNARLNQRSLQKAQQMRWLAGPAYQGLHAVLAQTTADAQRLGQLGAKVQGVLGNLKFDVQTDARLVERGLRWKQVAGDRPVVMLASFREGEETLWLQTLRVQPLSPKVLWLVVPRHPQRFDEVARLIDQAGLRVDRRSQWQGDEPASVDDEVDVWLGDSLGEMHAYYAAADVAFLGGSFLPLGGQNLIEAAACGCPVIMGQHTFNFADAAQQAEQVGAALRVDDMRGALKLTGQLLRHSEELAAARLATKELLNQGRGAAQRYATAVLRMWDEAVSNDQGANS